jgi:hypothetical protein
MFIKNNEILIWENILPYLENINNFRDEKLNYKLIFNLLDSYI